MVSGFGQILLESVTQFPLQLSSDAGLFLGAPSPFFFSSLFSWELDRGPLVQSVSPFLPS